MSVMQNGRIIGCDGQDCARCAQLQVALSGFSSSLSEAESPDGWLFATLSNQSFHFCPNCIPRYLQDRWQHSRAPLPAEDSRDGSFGNGHRSSRI